MKPERRVLIGEQYTAQLRSDENEDAPPVIMGHGAVFFDADDRGTEYHLWDNVYERISPEAFDDVLQQDVRGLFNHDSNMLLGRTKAGTMKLVKDERGLHYEIEPPDTQLGRDTLVLLKRGDLTGSSFSFIPDKTSYEETDDGRVIRTIEHVSMLFDVGPVTFPAYESADSEMRDAISAEMRDAMSGPEGETGPTGPSCPKGPSGPVGTEPEKGPEPARDYEKTELDDKLMEMQAKM